MAGETFIRPLPRRTYRASGNLTTHITAGVPVISIAGAAGRVVRLTKMKINAPTLTALQLLRLALAKYSTVGAGGTIVNPTKVPLSSNGAAPLATINTYTAAPAAGTLVGQISERTVLAQATVPTAGGALDEGDFDFTAGELSTEFPALRTAAENIALIFPVAPASAVTFSYMIEWTEDGN